MGEKALSKYFGVWWKGKGKIGDADVGKMDVRTSSMTDGSLILHSEDIDDRIYWLLTGKNGTYDVRGWLYGIDGKKSEYWKVPNNGRRAFFVPQSALNSPESFQFDAKLFDLRIDEEIFA